MKLVKWELKEVKIEEKEEKREVVKRQDWFKDPTETDMVLSISSL